MGGFGLQEYMFQNYMNALHRHMSNWMELHGILNFNVLTLMVVIQW